MTVFACKAAPAANLWTLAMETGGKCAPRRAAVRKVDMERDRALQQAAWSTGAPPGGCALPSRFSLRIEVNA
jgi:hypothetical protein